MNLKHGRVKSYKHIITIVESDISMVSIHYKGLIRAMKSLAIFINKIVQSFLYTYNYVHKANNLVDKNKRE